MSITCFRDDTGPVLPLCCHAGDLYSRHARGHDITPILREIAAAGYHGIRTWTCLVGQPYWAGREVMAAAGTLEAFVRLVADHGLGVMLSQGDLWQNSVTSAQRRQVRDACAAVLASGLRNAVLSADAANEGVNNGGATPDRLVEWLRPLADAHPDVIYTLTSPMSEEKADLAAYTQPPARVYDVHGNRDGGTTSIRHIFNTGYESAPVRLGIQSEPTGPGQRVSVGRESDPDVLCLMALASLISRQWFVYFCGPGVISDDPGQTFAAMPGFLEVPQAAALLPRDIMTWARLVHGGARSGSPRIYAVPTGNESARADHAIERADGTGKFACIMYGQGWERCTVARPHRIETDHTFGAAGRLVVGSLEA